MKSKLMYVLAMLVMLCGLCGTSPAQLCGSKGPAQLCPVGSAPTSATGSAQPTVVAMSQFGGESAQDGEVVYSGSPSVEYVRISWEMFESSAPAPAGSTVGPLRIIYTDSNGVVQRVTARAMLTNGTLATTTKGNSVNTLMFGIPLIIRVTANTPIKFTMDYSSNPVDTGGWNVFYVVESLPWVN